MNSFDTQIHIEELEIMNEKLFYDTKTEKYITESDLFEEYENYVDEGNYGATFSQYVNDCLTISGGTLERVGF